MARGAGDLDTRVTFIRYLTAGQDGTTNSFGERLKVKPTEEASPNSFRKVWAKVEYGSGAERRVGVAQEQASVLATLTIRESSLTSNLTTQKHYLQFHGKTWDIESVVPTAERSGYLSIVAKARV